MESTSAVGMALGTGPIVKSVLFLLIACSVVSWAIIFAKYATFKSARKESQRFLDLFWNAKSLDSIFNETRNYSSTPLAAVFSAGFIEFQKLTNKGQESGASLATIVGLGLENVQRALKKASVNENLRLEKMLPYLATIATAAPFVGLFGTVWGIMSSFQGLGSGGPATLQKVAPGISEALIATAVGLAAAIPAVIAYNQYVVRMKHFRAEMENFSSDFINILKRNYLG